MKTTKRLILTSPSGDVLEFWVHVCSDGSPTLALASGGDGWKIDSREQLFPAVQSEDKVVLHLELVSCADCPYKSQLGDYPYRWECRKDTRRNICESTSPNMTDMRPPIPDWCPFRSKS